jgi:hypothetical protein
MEQSALPHLRKYEQVKEVHAAEDEQHDANLPAESLQHPLKIDWHLPLSQSQTDVTDVDQIESDHEEMIDRVGQRFVAAKGVHEEYPAIPVQCFRHPDGERDADDEITKVSPNDRCHRLFSSFFVLFFSSGFRNY